MKIFLISYGIGGAEILNIIYEELYQKEGYDIQNISLTSVTKSYLKKAKSIKEKEIIQYIKENPPDLLINERSNGCEIQNKITALCNEMKIYNIAILDIFDGYSTRFTA